MSLTPRQENILSCLKKTTKDLSTKEVAQKTGHSQVGVSNDLKQMTSLGLVKRLPGKGHSFVYKFLSATVSPPVGYEIADRDRITKIYGTAHSLSWRPRILDSYVVLPETMIQLLQLAIDQRDGEQVKQSDLDQLLVKLVGMHKDVGSLFANVRSMLANKELWRIETFAEYIDIDGIGRL